MSLSEWAPVSVGPILCSRYVQWIPRPTRIGICGLLLFLKNPSDQSAVNMFSWGERWNIALDRTIPNYQSGFRASHSTERALLELLNVFTVSDDRRFTIDVSFDISSAFDTLSHSILLNRLRTEFGLSSAVGPLVSVRPTAVREARQ